MIDISIIIPVYKVEKYLHECVDSVLGQTYSNFEVILVDDGSPDKCPQICDEYASKDSRVKVVHKPNGGLSDARNAGAEIAEGEYLVFLDSDDYWDDADALKKCAKNLEENNFPDILYFRRWTFRDGEKAEVSRFPEFDIAQVNGKPMAEALEYLIGNDRFIPSACNKFVKRSLFIPFTKGIFSEDIDWNFGMTARAKSICATNECFYAYRKRQGSITMTLKERNVDDLLSIIEKWSHNLYQSNIDCHVRNALLGYCAYQLAIVLGLIFYIHNEGRRKEFLHRVHQLGTLWKFNLSSKVRKVNILRKYLGNGLAGRVLGLYIKLR